MKKNYFKKSTLVTVVISQLLLCFSATAYAASFGTNLVINGDAELGTTIGWTAVGPNASAFVVADAYFGEQVQAIHRKVLELYNGSPNVEATFSQTISISDFQGAVATGRVMLNFSAQAFSWYGAIASYTVDELDASGNVLSSHTTGIINLPEQGVNYQFNDSSACTWTTTSFIVQFLNISTSKLRISVYGKTSNTPEDFLDFDNIQLVLSAPPTLSTTTVTNVSKNSATIGGTVTSENGAGIIDRGYVYSATNVTPTIGGVGVTSINQTTGGSGTGTYSFTATGLSSNTTYYVSTYATNTAGTSYGTVKSFKTLAVAPTVATTSVTNITTTSAILNGTCNPNNSDATAWFRYATASPGVINDTFGTRVPTTGGVSMGFGTSPIPYSLQLSGLMPGVTYYYGAIATNEGGVSYGTVVSFTTKDIPVITWSNPADISYGTVLSETQLNATANVPGTFTYTPALGTKLNAGTAQTIKVDFTPTNLNYYVATSKTVTINVVKAAPEITWENPADITYGTLLSTTQLNATADVPGTFTYTPALGTKPDAGAAQNLKVDFTPDDATNYSSASKTVTINVAKAAPVITWSNPADITYGTALSATQLNAVADVPGTFTYTPSIGVRLDAGSSQELKVEFTPSDQNNYESAGKTVLINVFLSTGNTENGNNELIVVFPNPVMNDFHVTGFDGMATVLLTDLNGRTVLSKVISADEKVSVSNLSRGIYLIRITTGKGTVLKKMVKE